MWQALGDKPQIAHGEDEKPRLFAILLGKVVVSPLASPAASDLQAGMRAMVMSEARRASVQGYLEYEALQLFAFAEPIALQTAHMSTVDILSMVRNALGALTDFSSEGAAPHMVACKDAYDGWAGTFGPLLPDVAVAFAASIAAQVASGCSKCFHVVALTGKLNRKRLLADDDMPKKKLRTLRDQLPQVEASGSIVVEKRWGGSQGVRSAHMMLMWLDISQDLKQQRAAEQSARKHARLFSARSGIPEERILADLEFVSGRLLVKSRFRADCVANILHRQWWAGVSASGQPISVHLFIDASPQWRGVELYATSLDIFVQGRLFRRLAPLVSLGKTQLGFEGKLAGLLWQLYLLAGSSFAALQRLCSCVRSITTDLGTERLLSESAACIPAFCATMFPAEPLPAVGADDNFLFSRCMHIPGFRHMIDNIIQKALASLRAFPGFLVKLQSVVKFLRNDLNIGEICRSLEENGHHGLAEVLRRTSLVSIALWRWGTLAKACGALDQFILSLAEHFDPKPFADQRDTVVVRNVVAALRSATWLALFRFVKWYTCKLEDLMNWVGGCACHEAALQDGRAVSCDRKGRRLTEASAKVVDVLESMLAESDAWTEHFFNGDIELWREAQGVVRMSVEYASEKFAFLDRIPYLLARLPEAPLVARTPSDDNSPLSRQSQIHASLGFVSA